MSKKINILFKVLLCFTLFLLIIGDKTCFIIFGIFTLVIFLKYKGLENNYSDIKTKKREVNK